MKSILLLVLGVCLAGDALAQGHGPVFGFATPTNSQGEWSFDSGIQGRNGVDATQITNRNIVGYGFTPHLTLWVTLPAILANGLLPPTRINGGDDFEGKVAWRFHHQTTGVGTRFESTAFASLVVPGPQLGSGLSGSLARAPGVMLAAVTGVASRSQYFWVGGGYTRYMEREGDRRPGVLSYSLVYGYRPPSWRKEANHWDWRIFGEVTGEKSDHVLSANQLLAGTYALQAFAGPSVLGIKRNYAVEGGVQFPIYSDVGPLLTKERVRFAINFSYFLFQHQHDSH